MGLNHDTSVQTHLHPCDDADKLGHDAISEGHELLLICKVFLGAGKHHVALTLLWAPLTLEGVAHICYSVLRVKDMLVLPTPVYFKIFVLKPRKKKIIYPRNPKQFTDEFS